MPSTIKIRVIQAKDLPEPDCFVSIHFGNTKKQRTKTVYKSHSPVWKQDFRIEVHNDNMLQDLPVEFKVWDKELYSADDAVGSVFLDLNCLLMHHAPERIAGWFPIFDSLEGVRGQLCVSVKLEFFGDVNPFKTSAAGLQFFSLSRLEGYRITQVLGFVEELLVASDPEYHWRDSFRASSMCSIIGL